MLHRKWITYTEDEIREIKQTKCVKCPYASVREGRDASKVANWNSLTCDYILITHKRRGVRPEDCEHYKDKGIKKGVHRPL